MKNSVPQILPPARPPVVHEDNPNAEPTLNENRPAQDPPGKESPPLPLTKEQQPNGYIPTKRLPETEK